MGASGSLRGSLATEWGGSIKPKERLPRATVLNSEPPLQATQNGLIPEACEAHPTPLQEYQPISIDDLEYNNRPSSSEQTHNLVDALF